MWFERRKKHQDGQLLAEAEEALVRALLDWALGNPHMVAVLEALSGVQGEEALRESSWLQDNKARAQTLIRHWLQGHGDTALAGQLATCMCEQDVPLDLAFEAALALQNHFWALQLPDRRPFLEAMTRFCAVLVNNHEQACLLRQERIFDQQVIEQRAAIEHQMLEAFAAGVCIFEADGSVRTVNQAFCRLVGGSRDELVSGSLQALIPSQRLEQERSQWKAALHGEPRRHESALCHRDGHEVDMEVTYTCFEKTGSGQPLIMATCVDLAAFKSQERQLTAIRVAVDVADTKIMIANQQGIITYANPSAQKLFTDHVDEVRKRIPHFDPSRIVGTSYDVYHRDPAGTRQLIRQMHDVYGTQIHFGERTFSFIGHPIFMQGERVGTTVEWRDITEELAVQKEVEELIEHMRSGDLDLRLKPKESIAAQKLVEAVNALLDETLTLVDYSQGLLQRLAQARLVPDTAPVFGAALEIQQAYNETVTSLQTTIHTVNEAAAAIDASGRELVINQNDLSERSSRESASIEEISASVEELSSAVSESARNAEHTFSLAESVSESTREGKQVVDHVTWFMTEVAKGARETSLISRAIQQISFQTNILSLNASVEAAKAGEEGKGFSVIAAEIRKLALHSSQEAARAEGIIDALLRGMDKGEQGILQVAERIESIQAQVAQMTDHVKSIAHAAREQDVGLAEIAKGIAVVEQGLSQNALLAEDIRATSDALMLHTEKLLTAIGHFHMDGGLDAEASADGGQWDKAILHAINRHLAWRNRLSKALASGEIDLHEAGDENGCALGRWLADNQKTLSRLAEYNQILLLHKAFHKEARKVAQLIQRGEKNKARGILEGKSRYNALTDELVQQLKKLLRNDAQPTTHKLLAAQASSLTAQGEHGSTQEDLMDAF